MASFDVGNVRTIRCGDLNQRPWQGEAVLSLAEDSAGAGPPYFRLHFEGQKRNYLGLDGTITPHGTGGADFIALPGDWAPAEANTRVFHKICAVVFTVPDPKTARLFARMLADVNKAGVTVQPRNSQRAENTSASRPRAQSAHVSTPSSSHQPLQTLLPLQPFQHPLQPAHQGVYQSHAPSSAPGASGPFSLEGVLGTEAAHDQAAFQPRARSGAVSAGAAASHLCSRLGVKELRQWAQDLDLTVPPDVTRSELCRQVGVALLARGVNLNT